LGYLAGSELLAETVYFRVVVLESCGTIIISITQDVRPMTKISWMFRIISWITLYIHIHTILYTIHYIYIYIYILYIYIYIYIYILYIYILYILYILSDNSSDGIRGHVERTKMRRKVLYYFTIFAIVNEILVSKNYRIRMSTRPTITPSVCPLLARRACQAIPTPRSRTA